MDLVKTSLFVLIEPAVSTQVVRMSNQNQQTQL